MNGQSLVSLALSFLMVGLAAVVLRPSEHDRASAPPAPVVEPVAARSAIEVEKPPEIAGASPRRDREPAALASSSTASTPRYRLTAVSTQKPLPSPRSEPAPLPAGAVADGDVEETIRSPRSAFTEVEPGETLGLVARRVYGSSRARDRLWRGNRDLLPDPEVALRPGTILRTP